MPAASSPARAPASLPPEQAQRGDRAAAGEQPEQAAVAAGEPELVEPGDQQW